MSSIEKLHTGRILRAAAVWLLGAALCLAAAALAAARFRWSGEATLRLSALGIVIPSAVSAAVVLGGRKGKGRLIAALLFALVIAAILLMLGFLILPEGPDLAGLVRVVLSAALGSCLGAALTRSGKAKQSRIRPSRAAR